MNAEEFIVKFPATDRINTNCLEDMACPECGSRGPFTISVDTAVMMRDSGVEEVVGDYAWDRDSWCLCKECDHNEQACYFTFQGLETLLKARTRDNDKESACRQCGAPNADNGEGWDGLCGNCADKAERGQQ